MIISSPTYKSPVPVIAVFAPRMEPWPPLSSDVQFEVFNGKFIEGVREGDCVIVDPCISDFIFINKKLDDGVVAFMWKPIADTGLWTAMRDFDPSALKVLHDLMKGYT